jgi:hypothetical protein
LIPIFHADFLYFTSKSVECSCYLPLLSQTVLDFLDSLLALEPDSGRTTLYTLRQHATTNTPAALVKALDKRALLQGSNLAKPQNLAKSTLSNRATELKQAPKVRFAHSTTHFTSIRLRFCWDLRSGVLTTSQSAHCANFSAAYRIGAGVSRHNALILWVFLPSLTFFGRKIGFR